MKHFCYFCTQIEDFNEVKPIEDKKMKIAVVGATGLVGSKMLQVLDEQNGSHRTGRLEDASSA